MSIKLSILVTLSVIITLTGCSNSELNARGKLAISEKENLRASGGVPDGEPGFVYVSGAAVFESQGNLTLVPQIKVQFKNGNNEELNGAKANLKLAKKVSESDEVPSLMGKSKAGALQYGCDDNKEVLKKLESMRPAKDYPNVSKPGELTADVVYLCGVHEAADLDINIRAERVVLAGAFINFATGPSVRTLSISARFLEIKEDSMIYAKELDHEKGSAQRGSPIVKIAVSEMVQGRGVLTIASTGARAL